MIIDHIHLPSPPPPAILCLISAFLLLYNLISGKLLWKMVFHLLANQKMNIEGGVGGWQWEGFSMECFCGSIVRFALMLFGALSIKSGFDWEK